MPRSVSRIAIIGGGISGLAAAHRLVELAAGRQKELDVILLEAKSRLGGLISTRSYGDFIIESGPDSFITQKPWAIDLCRRLGLASQLMGTCEENRRTFVALRGRLHPLPEGFVMLAPTDWRSFLGSSLFTWPGKLRMALDLVLPPRRETGDESLASFVARRFGKEALERVAQPMIGGIYTADPGKLSMLATFPKFLELEQAYRSVIRGLAKEQQALETAPNRPGGQQSGARYSLFASLQGGLQLLVDRLAERIPPHWLRLGAPVSGLAQPAGGQGWRIALASGEGLMATALILATPVNVTASLLGDLDAQLSSDLASIPLASSVVLNFVYAREDIPHQLDGFGFVVPALERRSIIACSFASRKFSGRAPEGNVILRVFMAGALAPEIYRLSDDDLVASARQDLELYLGVRANPLSASLVRHPDSMPQFHVGHLERLARIEERVRCHRGLALAGNAYRGVGIPDCIHSGEMAAESLLRWISTLE